MLYQFRLRVLDGCRMSPAPAKNDLPITGMADRSSPFVSTSARSSRSTPGQPWGTWAASGHLGSATGTWQCHLGKGVAGASSWCSHQGIAPGRGAPTALASPRLCTAHFGPQAGTVPNKTSFE